MSGRKQSRVNDTLYFIESLQWSLSNLSPSVRGNRNRLLVRKDKIVARMRGGVAYGSESEGDKALTLGRSISIAIN